MRTSFDSNQPLGILSNHWRSVTGEIQGRQSPWVHRLSRSQFAGDVVEHLLGQLSLAVPPAMGAEGQLRLILGQRKASFGILSLPCSSALLTHAAIIGIISGLVNIWISGTLDSCATVDRSSNLKDIRDMIQRADLSTDHQVHNILEAIVDYLAEHERHLKMVPQIANVLPPSVRDIEAKAHAEEMDRQIP